MFLCLVLVFIFVFLCLTRGAQPDKKIATRQVQRLKSPLWIEISTDHTLKVKGYELKNWRFSKSISTFKIEQNKIVQKWLARRMSLHNVLFRHAAKLSRLVQTRADGAGVEWQNCTTRQEVETSTCRCSGGKVDTLAEIFADWSWRWGWRGGFGELILSLTFTLIFCMAMCSKRKDNGLYDKHTNM